MRPPVSGVAASAQPAMQRIARSRAGRTGGTPNGVVPSFAAAAGVDGAEAAGPGVGSDALPVPGAVVWAVATGASAAIASVATADAVPRRPGRAALLTERDMRSQLSAACGVS
jgi:hypothetical protein